MSTLMWCKCLCCTYNVILVSHMNKKEQVDILNTRFISLPIKGGPGSWLICKNLKMEKIKIFSCFCGERGMCGRMPQLCCLHINGWMLAFHSFIHSPIIKKIQSSKSWYLQIALILSIENPLPRGVVDKVVNTNPEVRGIEPPLKHLHKSKMNLVILYSK